MKTTMRVCLAVWLMLSTAGSGLGQGSINLSDTSGLISFAALTNLWPANVYPVNISPNTPGAGGLLLTGP